MERSAIILAGGPSERFGEFKALTELRHKPLISYVFEKVQGISDEVLIVASSEEGIESFSPLFGSIAKIVVDKGEFHSPLIGALAGFENASGDYSLLLPCDTPFVSRELLMLLFDLCVGVDAVIPRWPNDHIEPLHAAYRTKSALYATKLTLSDSRMDMRSMISLLKTVRYVSTSAFKQIDPHLNTFFNVNTRLDLRKAERIKD